MNPADELRRQTYASLLVVATFATLGVAFRFAADYSRVVLALLAFWIVFGLPLVRALTKSVLSRSRWYGLPMYILGAPERTRSFASSLDRNPALGIRPILIGMDTERVSLDRARHVLIVSKGMEGKRLGDVLDTFTPRFPNVWLVPELLDTTSAWVRAYDLNGHLALKLRNNLLEPKKVVFKRFAELLILGLASPILIVAFIAVAIAVRADSPGPVFFAHKRVGRHGRAFRLLKFRTMHCYAEQRVRELLRSDPATAREWARTRKLRQDPRTTRVGRFLRRTSLDELPQVINVVRGEMSLVGPRAITRTELHEYGER